MNLTPDLDRRECSENLQQSIQSATAQDEEVIVCPLHLCRSDRLDRLFAKSFLRSLFRSRFQPPLILVPTGAVSYRAPGHRENFCNVGQRDPYRRAWQKRFPSSGAEWTGREDHPQTWQVVNSGVLLRLTDFNNSSNWTITTLFFDST